MIAPPVILFCDYALLSGRLGLIRGGLLSIATIFAIVVSTAVLYDRLLEARLAAFDHDGDGVFAGSEVTPDQERALFLVTNDVSRTLAPITGGIFAVGYTALTFGVVAVARRVRQRPRSAA